MNRIRELRQKFRMTQEDLAECLGVVRQAIIKYETGQTIPPMRKAEMLSKLFGVPMAYLLGESDVDHEINDREATILNLLDRLDSPKIERDIIKQLQRAVLEKNQGVVEYGNFGEADEEKHG